MPVLKFKDKDGVVKATPGLKIVTEKNVINPSLNVHFGQTPPEDTSKLWVKTNKTPSDVIISPQIMGEKNILTRNVATLPYTYLDLPAVACVNNIIYIFGGYSNDGLSNKILKFIPETGELITLNTTLTNASRYKSPIVIGNLIYLFTYNHSFNAPADVFNTETETLINTQITTQSGEGDVVCINNKIYHLYNGTNAYEYDLSTNNWNTMTDVISVYRNNIRLVSIGTKIYLIGGTTVHGGYVAGYTYRDTIHVFDTSDGSFKECAAKLPYKLNYVDPVVVGTDIYMFGGYDYNSTYTMLDTVIVYDTLNDTVRVLDVKLPNANYGMGAVLCGTDIYLIGGYNTNNGNAIMKFSLKQLLKKETMHIQTTANGSSLCKLIKNPLLETSIKKVFMGDNDGYAKEVNSYIYDYVPQFTQVKNKQYTSNCIENSGGTSSTLSIDCNVGDLIIASIITRDTLTLSNGWTLISTSNVNSEYVSGNGQRLSFAYKYAENTTETITVTQTSSQRLYITTIALQGATGFIDNGYSYANSQSSASISVTKPEGLTLLACSADLWGSSTPYPLWTVSDNSEIIQLGTSTQSRLGVILDQNAEMSELNIVPGGTSSPIVVGSLTITGMDKFYDVNEWSGGEMWKLL